jgi:hypothetical protein
MLTWTVSGCAKALELVDEVADAVVAAFSVDWDIIWCDEVEAALPVDA